jgi:hypothetical protein
VGIVSFITLTTNRTGRSLFLSRFLQHAAILLKRFVAATSSAEYFRSLMFPYLRILHYLFAICDFFTMKQLVKRALPDNIFVVNCEPCSHIHRTFRGFTKKLLGRRKFYHLSRTCLLFADSSLTLQLWPRGAGFLRILPGAVTSTADHPSGSPSLPYSSCRWPAAS